MALLSLCHSPTSWEGPSGETTHPSWERDNGRSSSVAADHDWEEGVAWLVAREESGRGGGGAAQKETEYWEGSMAKRILGRK